MRSVLEKPPGWLRSRNEYAGYFANFLSVGEEDIQTMTEDEYTARMLGAFCRIARNTTVKNKSYIDYRELKGSFIKVANKLWQIHFSDTEINTIDEIAQLYSKDIYKKERFKPDSEEKRAKATKIQIELVDSFVESERLKLINA